MKLYSSIDFFDEMCYAVWTPAMLREYFQLQKDFGIDRIYWIDQLEIMMDSGEREHAENMRKTWQNFGGKLHEAAVAAAHDAGMEIFALIKPYDLGMITPALSDGAENGRTLPVAGNVICRFADFAARHPEVMLQRTPNPQHKRAHHVILQFASPLNADAEVEWLCSTDNRHYQSVERKIVPAGTSSLEFPVGNADFYAVVVSGGNAGNQLKSLVTAVDAEGCPVPAALAVMPRKRFQPFAFHLDHDTASDSAGGFRSMGLLFDYFPGIPSSLYPADYPGEWDFRFAEAEEQVLGISLRINPRIAGCPDPANPTFRQFVRTWITRELEYGFDGVDIRVSNHNSPLFWSEYGTGEPVRLARGQAHTALLRELSETVRGAGRIMSCHIEDFMLDCHSDAPCPMEFYWNPQQWLAEKLLDEATCKIIFDDDFSPAVQKLSGECLSRGVKFNFCPFLHVVTDPLDYASRIRTLGADAFNIYEAATVWQYRNNEFYEVDPQKSAQLRKIPQLQ